MKEDDYSRFRLPDEGDWISDIIKKMGLKEFTDYEYKVYDALNSLKEGKFYAVSDVPEQERELFIKICCLYIRNHHNVVFNGTYTRIYKEVKYEPRKMDNRRKKICDRERGETVTSGNGRQN